jgi:hypothetical protein
VPFALVNEYPRQTLLVVRDPRDKIIPDTMFDLEFSLFFFSESCLFFLPREPHTLQHTPAVVFTLNHPFMYCTAST